MIPLAYNISSKLEKILAKTVKQRRVILLATIPPKVELRLRWEAQIARIYWSLVLSANPLTRTQVAKTVSKGLKLKKISPHQKEVLNYKDALGYIQSEWLVSQRDVSINTLNTLFNISCKGVFPQSANNLQKHKDELNGILDYLNKSTEHPIIQAAIAQIQLVNIAPFAEGNGRIARLIAYLFLYKSGYDYRGLLVFDEYLRKDVVSLKQAIDLTIRHKNLSIWLEYFALGVSTQLEKAIETIQENRFITDLSASYWKLNTRQKQVLENLDEPGAKITNKEVQKRFKVSQITASRDLSKLVSLDLLFSHGKGRSTYYTKV